MESSYTVEYFGLGGLSMITMEEQQSLFIAVGRRLSRRVTAYAVGGTAMMFQGFKDETLDIDLVF